MSSTPSKLIELRRKTDRELPEMVLRELERGLTLTSVAANSGSPMHQRADRIYSRMKTLLPTLGGLDPAQRSQLESKLKELRAALDRVPGKRIQWELVTSARDE
jgi:hypothetical protein